LTNNKKFKIKSDRTKFAVYHDKDFLSIFGCYGSDFLITNDCNVNEASYSSFGDNYELPEGLEKGTDEAKAYLGGSEHFKVKEIEVFKVEF
jgi:hypothetical protein